MKCVSVASILTMALVAMLTQTSELAADESSVSSLDRATVLRPAVYTPFYRDPPPGMKQDKLAIAVFRAVDSLLAMQNEDGSWNEGGETNLCTSMACIALISVGEVPFAAPRLTKAHQWLVDHPPLDAPDAHGSQMKQWCHFQSIYLRHRAPFLTTQQAGILSEIEKQLETDHGHEAVPLENPSTAQKTQIQAFFVELFRCYAPLSGAAISHDGAQKEDMPGIRKRILSQQRDDGGFGEMEMPSSPLPTSLAISALMLSHPMFFAIDDANRFPESNRSSSPMDLL